MFNINIWSSEMIGCVVNLKKFEEITGAMEPTSAAVRNRHRQKAMR
jgi:hypothetical protein